MGKMAIKIETKFRLIAQICVYIATGITQFGFQDNEVAKYISLACALVVTGYNFWKNNSFTQAAIAADEFMSALKNGELDVELVDEEEE